MSKIEFKYLFEPIEIGPCEIKNRLAQSPMNLMISQDGFMTEQERAIHAARAKGGYGLSIIGAFLGTKMASEFPAHVNLHIFHPKYLPPLVELTDTIHNFGGKVFAQISIGFGRQGHNWDGKPRYSASPVAITLEGAQAPVPAFKDIPAFRDFLKKFTETPRAMSVEEIKREEREFVRSVWLAMCAGFDGVEIHAPHGYLLHQFLSPLTNKRTDEYGGSLENRMRFLLEVAKLTKEMCGEFPVGVRISAEEHIPGGLTIDDMKIVAKELEKVGIDYINLSDGGGFGDPKGGFGDVALSKEILEHSSEIKKAVKIPVIAPVWTGSPEEAEKAIKDGKVDIIEMARQSLVDPETPNKIKSGKINEIVKCTRCNICCNKQYALKGGICCPLNPKLGYEKYMPEYKVTSRPKEVPVLTWGQRHLPPEPPP